MKRFLVGLVLALSGSIRPVGWLRAQQCGGTERWPVKVGTDNRSTSVQLLSPVPLTLHDLINLPTPQMPPLSDNATRLNEETHVYEVMGRLIKFKHETDADYHLVVTDETLIFTDDQAGTPPGHSVIVEIPDPSCFAGAHGGPHPASRFATAIKSARSELEARFPNIDATGAWNDARGTPVRVVGVGFFDRPHHQVGRASNNIELHPVLDIVFNPTPTPPVTVSTPAVPSPAVPLEAMNAPLTTTVATPADHSTVTGPVNITATGSGAVTKLELYVDGAIVACNVKATSISYPWDTGKSTNGPHTITSRAYDALGNVIVSAPVTATVAN